MCTKSDCGGATSSICPVSGSESRRRRAAWNFSGAETPMSASCVRFPEPFCLLALLRITFQAIDARQHSISFARIERSASRGQVILRRRNSVQGQFLDVDHNSRHSLQKIVCRFSSIVRARRTFGPCTFHQRGSSSGSSSSAGVLGGMVGAMRYLFFQRCSSARRKARLIIRRNTRKITDGWAFDYGSRTTWQVDSTLNRSACRLSARLSRAAPTNCPRRRYRGWNARAEVV